MAESKKVHICHETGRFDVFMAGYPHAVFRCGECQSPMRSKAVDDLDEKDFEMALEMILEYRKRKLEGGDDPWS